MHAWIVILCKHLSDGGWYSHYLILLKKKCQNHGQNLHSSCKVNFRFEPKIDLLPNDLMIHHENSRRRVSGSIHLLFKPFLDVLLDYYDMNVWRIPKQILDGKVEYHSFLQKIELLSDFSSHYLCGFPIHILKGVKLDSR